MMSDERWNSEEYPKDAEGNCSHPFCEVMAKVTEVFNEYQLSPPQVIEVVRHLQEIAVERMTEVVTEGISRLLELPRGERKTALREMCREMGIAAVRIDPSKTPEQVVEELVNQGVDAETARRAAASVGDKLGKGTVH